jgi:predicted dehydrogenase
VLSISIIGAGLMGRHHARVFRSLAKVVGVTDARPGAATTLAREVGAEAWSLEESIARSDAIVVATPMETHAGIVKAALLAGRHVLVEKPICTSSERGWELGKLARERGVVLAVGHSERFNPAVRALYEVSLADPIVHLETVRLAVSALSSMLLNLAVHDLDLARHLGHAPLVLAGAKGHDDWALLSTQAPSFSATHEVARRSPHRVRTLRATTRSGRIHEADLLSGFATPDQEPLLVQARAFLDRIRGISAPELASADDGAGAVDLALQAEARTPREVAVKLSEPRVL